MKELLIASFTGGNIIPTFLLLFVLVYWLIVMIGVIDVDVLDFEVEVEAEANVEGAGSIMWFNHVLAFFNLGRIPFMVFMSFFALPFWATSVLLNHYLFTQNTLLSFLWLIPTFFGSLLIAKFLTIPFVKLFAALEKENFVEANAVGKMCQILLPVSYNRLGQASVKINGASQLVNVKTREGLELEKGKSGLIIEYNENGKYYLVEPFEI